MKAQQTRPGGRHVLIERGGREVAVQVEEQQAPVAQQATTAPLWEHAKIQAGAVLTMAKVCEVSVPEFVRRYV
jgi:hypothetical protein